MKITISMDFDKRHFDKKQDVLFLGLFEEDKPLKELSEELKDAEKRKVFSKKLNETYLTKLTSHEKVLLLGLGKRKEFDLEKLRRAFGGMVNTVKSLGYTSFMTDVVELALSCKLDPEMTGRAVSEGLWLADYYFTKYLGKEKKEKHLSLTSVFLRLNQSSAFEKGFKTGEVVAKATNFVRDLVNEPASVVNSDYLEKVAKELAQDSHVKLKVLEKKEMQKLGMNALLGVNAGSRNPPKLLILEYNNGKGRPTALIGKGITFDSGGYNLKPTKYIEDMKTDMAGGAAVLGSFRIKAQQEFDWCNPCL